MQTFLWTMCLLQDYWLWTNLVAFFIIKSFSSPVLNPSEIVLCLFGTFFCSWVTFSDFLCGDHLLGENKHLLLYLKE